LVRCTWIGGSVVVGDAGRWSVSGVHDGRGGMFTVMYVYRLALHIYFLCKKERVLERREERGLK
jgi:hypothetical protein